MRTLFRAAAEMDDERRRIARELHVNTPKITMKNLSIQPLLVRHISSSLVRARSSEVRAAKNGGPRSEAKISRYELRRCHV